MTMTGADKNLSYKLKYSNLPNYCNLMEFMVLSCLQKTTFISVLKRTFVIDLFIPSLPDITNFSTIYFSLSKVYNDEGGIKCYTTGCPPVREVTITEYACKC